MTTTTSTTLPTNPIAPKQSNSYKNNDGPNNTIHDKSKTNRNNNSDDNENNYINNFINDRKINDSNSHVNKHSAMSHRRVFCFLA